MKKDSLGDRMKGYEAQYSSQQLLPLIPIVARMDGKAFHTFTAGLKRPYDERLSRLMVATTKYLVQETNAKIGYTQSDEISLVWYNEEIDSDSFFDAKLLKMTSVLASMTTAFFNRNLKEHLPEKADRVPLFDARVYNVPTDWEATNYLIWREMDATRNSISMAAQSMFSHNQLQNKSSSDMQEMMFATHGINWNNYPDFFKRGTYIARKKVIRPFTTEEIDKLPAMHSARKNPGLTVVRQEVAKLELPPLKRVANREEVIFSGAEVVLKAVEMESEPTTQE